MNIESYDKLYDFRIIFSIWIIDDIFDWNFLILQLLIVSTFNSILRNEYFYIHYSEIVFYRTLHRRFQTLIPEGYFWYKVFTVDCTAT